MSIPTMILVDKDTIVNKWVGFTKSEIINKYFSELNNKKDNETN